MHVQHEASQHNVRHTYIHVHWTWIMYSTHTLPQPSVRIGTSNVNKTADVLVYVWRFVHIQTQQQQQNRMCCCSNACVFVCVRACVFVRWNIQFNRTVYTYMRCFVYNIEFRIAERIELNRMCTSDKKKNYNLANSNLNLTAWWKFDLNAYQVASKTINLWWWERNWRKIINIFAKIYWQKTSFAWVACKGFVVLLLLLLF